MSDSNDESEMISGDSRKTRKRVLRAAYNNNE